MLKTFLLFVSLITIASCKENSTKSDKYSSRDSFLKQHLLAIDSLSYYDTTDIDYRILRAYYQNDTNYFKKKRTDLGYNYNGRGVFENLDSCVRQPSLKGLNADEAFRFIYIGGMCPFIINATISKIKNNYNLHYIVYRPPEDTTKCQIITEFDKTITFDNWTKIEQSLINSDFWGMKEDNGDRGLDGDELVIQGYLKGDTTYSRQPKSHFVYRWGPGHLTIFEAFASILRLSRNKQGCLWLE